MAVPTFSIAGKEPKLLKRINLTLTNVMQCAVQDPTTGDFYVSQATSVGASTGNESAIVSRVSSSGKVLDSMTLQSGGHGSSFGVQRVGSKVYLWWSWQEALAGGNKNDLVRFEYRAGATLTRAQTSYFTVLPKFPASARYVLMSLDIPNGYVAYRDLNGTTETWTRRKIADVLAGTDKAYGTFTSSVSGKTFQSFATIDDSLYYYSGTANPAYGDNVVTEYKWADGTTTGSYDTSFTGLGSDGLYPGNTHEPEGASLYLDSAGKPSLLIGVTMGPHGARLYDLYTFQTPSSTPKPAPKLIEHKDPARATPRVPPPPRWRYIAERRNGDGTGEILTYDVPLRSAELTRTLSGPGSLGGSISPEVQRLKDDKGQPIFQKWSTCIWAEADGELQGGGILTGSSFENGEWKLDCTGFSTYPKGQPYTDARYWIDADPMDLAREIWKHLQAQRNGNLGVTLDPTTSPVRVGTELRQGQYDAQTGPSTYQVGAYKLNWYSTTDLGKEFDDLAKMAPFDYRERVYWNGDDVALRLELGYPLLGARRDDLRFVVGENVFEVPGIGTNEDYANEVLALGAGEGSVRKRASAVRNDGRLRRVKVVDNKSWKSDKLVQTGAKDNLADLTDFDTITQVVVLNHSHAPIGSWAEGDEILVQSNAGWRDVAIWCRIISTTYSPEGGDAATLTLLRSED